MNDVPLMVVARNLGYGDTRMVEKHYGHLSTDFVPDAIRQGAPRFGFKLDRKGVRWRRYGGGPALEELQSRPMRRDHS